MRISSLPYLVLVACHGSSGTAVDASASVDAAATSDAPAAAAGLGTVTTVTDLAQCPSGAPPGTTCKRITVTGCPEIAGEALDATVAIAIPAGAATGTVVHFSGGGGLGWETVGAQTYASANLRQVFVAWANDWELTTSSGIKTAACRPATILKWVFDDPALHAGSRALPFCGQGFSGGSGQLGYALATYGMGAYLDYVNELSGPPFARIDLGCDGSAAATAQVCGATDTMRLPLKLDNWENTTSCGSTTPLAADVAKWRADSILTDGVYSYPRTEVQFHDCTYQATAVTAMAQLYYGEIAASEGNAALASYHCYSQADGCQGESLGTGAGQAAQALVTGCVTRH